jgi:hypothetical protein
VNPPWVRLGQVGAECILGASSLILRLIAFLLIAYLALGGGGEAVTTLALLPVRVFVDPTLAPLNEALTESALKARAETGIAGIGDPLSKPRMWDEKLSKAYNEICNV